MRPCQGQSDNSHEQAQRGGLRQLGVFHVEAACLGVAEQTFDLPAPVVKQPRRRSARSWWR
jgi:hypothetical protein